MTAVTPSPGHANGGDDDADAAGSERSGRGSPPAPGQGGGPRRGRRGRRGAPRRRRHARRVRRRRRRGTPTLTWYINPDSGGQAEIASAAPRRPDGDYTIEVPSCRGTRRPARAARPPPGGRGRLDRHHESRPAVHPRVRPGRLPRAGARRRRAAGHRGRRPERHRGSTWDDELVAVPFWANTQLLWYRKSVAEAAGLDMTQPVTWDQLIEAAQGQDKLISAQGIRGRVADRVAQRPRRVRRRPHHRGDRGRPGGHPVRSRHRGRRARRRGHARRRHLRRGRPGLLHGQRGHQRHRVRERRRRLHGQLAVRLPQAPTAVEAGTLEPSVPDDYGWTLYPRVDEDKPSAPPYGGINLGVGASARTSTSPTRPPSASSSDENQAYYFETNGNPAASRPRSTTTPRSSRSSRWRRSSGSPWRWRRPGRRPSYYSEVSGGTPARVPPGDARSTRRPPAQQADDLISAVLAGDQLL